MENTFFPSTLASVRRLANDDFDRPAVLYEEETTTYGQLDRASNAVAQGLLREGITPQARIGLLDFNHPSFFEVYLGALKTRCALTPVNARLAPPEIAWILNDAQAPILFVGRDHYAIVERIEPELRYVRRIVAMHGGHPRWIEFRQWRDANAATDPGLPYDQDDDIVQLYTSGTTGHPKGVCHTHRTWGDAGRALSMANSAMFDPTCISLVCLPLFHVAGFNPSCYVLASAGRIVLTRRSDPAEIMTLLHRHAVTNTLLVPALILAIVHLTPRPQPVPTLRSLGYGASPMAQELLSEARKLFACPFEHLYGMTENAGAVTSLSPAMHDPALGKLKSCGKPYVGCDVRVVDPDGRDVPAGQVGEIIMRSSWIMRGYWNQPAATASTVRDGWLWTGDAGYLDADGFLYIHDRVKDMIKSGSENVYPAEVENAIYGHPSVADVAVIGVPDERWGEAVKAVLVLKPGGQLDTDELQRYLRDRIGGFKIPKSFDVVTALPRNASGKVLRRVLREQYGRKVTT